MFTITDFLSNDDKKTVASPSRESFVKTSFDDLHLDALKPSHVLHKLNELKLLDAVPPSPALIRLDASTAKLFRAYSKNNVTYSHADVTIAKHDHLFSNESCTMTFENFDLSSVDNTALDCVVKTSHKFNYIHVLCVALSVSRHVHHVQFAYQSKYARIDNVALVSTKLSYAQLLQCFHVDCNDLELCAKILTDVLVLSCAIHQRFKSIDHATCNTIARHLLHVDSVNADVANDAPAKPKRKRTKR